MIDENAYGLLIAWFDLEDVEYPLEREQFIERYRELKTAFQRCLDELPLGRGVTVLDLGHAFYLEVGETDESADPIRWLRDVRGRLTELGFMVLGVVCHGGRWIDAVRAAEPTEQRPAQVQIVRASLPSEPLRKALAAEAAAHPSSDDEEGWGPGIYVESEVIEALGRKLKNVPTPLLAAETEFYRIG